MKCQLVFFWHVACVCVSWWLVRPVNGYAIMDQHAAADDDGGHLLAPLDSDSEGVVPEESLFFLDNVPRGVVKVKAGEKVVLDCEASGRPTPTIHWLFDGKRIAQGDSQSVMDDEAVYEEGTSSAAASSQAAALRVGSTKSRLFIDCFGASHVGKYTCVAETPEGRITSTATLKTDKGSRGLISSKSTGCSSSAKRNSQGNDRSPARIFMWTSQRLEFEGRDVQLYCRAEGTPAPRITWFKDDGKPIDVTQSRYLMLPNGDLVIKDIGWSDMGLYTCSAENDVGKDEAGVFLYPTTP